MQTTLEGRLAGAGLSIFRPLALLDGNVRLGVKYRRLLVDL